MKNNRFWLRISSVWLVALVAVFTTLWPAAAQAAGSGDFTIQVSPSPLVITLKPGVAQTATLTIRNLSNHSETLIPKLNAFTVGENTTDVKLLDSAPAELTDWISFGQPSVKIAAGSSQQLDVRYNTPKNVGFSYSVAITLNRADDSTQQSGAHYKASVAVFNLINIDRPDAKRELTITSFSADKSTYEFLPATFKLTVKNTGNVIVQPSGNIFVQRGFNSNKPLAAIALNPGGGYILPGSSRTLESSWSKGFPNYVTEKDDNGKTSKHLNWDWKHIGDLRFGKYTAKVVLVYNDGRRDVPLTSSDSFWVIPWRVIFFVILILVILVTGVVGWGKIIARGTGKIRKKYAARRH